MPGPLPRAERRPVFRDVDADDAAHLVAMMAATDAWPEVQAARAWVLDQVATLSAPLVVDVGCGPGTFGASARARGARTVDVDRSLAMLVALRGSHARAAVGLADIGQLPLRDGVADLVHVERVLQWTADLDAALAELRRVTAPGGCLAMTDTDWGTFAVDHPDPAVAGRMAAAAVGWVAHPRLAPSLPGRLRELGAVDLAVRRDVVSIDTWDPDDHTQADGPPGLPLRAMADGAPPAERAASGADVDRLADLARHGRFRAVLTIVTAVGRL